MRWFRRWYGANPLHLLSMIAGLALAGYGADKLLARNAIGILVWLAGAVIGHDLLLMPLYTLADRSVMAVFRHRQTDMPAVPWINFLRVPVALSGLLLLIWFPLIFRLPKHFQAYTTLSENPYIWHWLGVTGALFLLSAIALAFRMGTGRRGRRTPGRRVAGSPSDETYPEQPWDALGRRPEQPWDAPGRPERPWGPLGRPEQPWGAPGRPERPWGPGPPEPPRGAPGRRPEPPWGPPSRPGRPEQPWGPVGRPEPPRRAPGRRPEPPRGAPGQYPEWPGRG
jgi:hypothetical protein